MKKRNWLELSRKLVDRYDLDFTVEGMSSYVEQAVQSFFGAGVLKTTMYPTPFPITLSGVLLGGSVAEGVAYDADGKLTSINPDTTGGRDFSITPPDVFASRWDLLVVRYKEVGDTPVPKPSDPITTIDLNLHDDFELILRPGIADVNPVYPAKQAGDVILAGIIVPPNVTLGTECFVDMSIRELALPDAVKYPVFMQESLTGVIDGYNNVFTLSADPINGQSVLISMGNVVRYQTADYTIAGRTVTFFDAPALAQTRPYAWYITDASSSVNPLSAIQEVPSGIPNGVLDTFGLSGMPADKESTLVFKNGLAVDAADWDLIQGLTASSIKFHAGEIPELAEELYVFFLINPATIGQAPSGGGTGIFVPFYHQVTPTDIANKYIVLPSTPTIPSSNIFDLPSGAPQVYGVDFIIVGNHLDWNGLGLDGIIGAGDYARIIITS